MEEGTIKFTLEHKMLLLTIFVSLIHIDQNGQLSLSMDSSHAQGGIIVLHRTEGALVESTGSWSLEE